MPLTSTQFFSKDAQLRFDIQSQTDYTPFMKETDFSFLNYRLANVQVAEKVTRRQVDILWKPDLAVKDIRYANGTLEMDGEWFSGEIQKINVSMLAMRQEESGLHPFHSSAVYYKGKTILFMGGENNHGKTMCQLEGCRRGGLNISTETTVIDDRGWVALGSLNVYLAKRAKGTERSDLANQDEGVTKLFGKAPEVNHYTEPSNVDVVVLPSIDGNYSTSVKELGQFEKEYQGFHSMMNYFGLNQLLAPGLVMPIIDTKEKRQKRAEFGHRFAEPRPYYMIRAATPQLIFDELEKFL
ncbi:MAG TPA: hypothetical protein VLM83_02955 [Anaerolineales bacterium]|nr:hypothetical protein [Anaerolineales bacterium]